MISSLLIAIVLVMGFVAVAIADSSVTYEGGSEKFAFLPGNEADFFE